MYLLSRLGAKDIFIDIPKTDFNGIVFHIIKNSRFSPKKDAFREILARENIGTTAIGHNVAIPHCRLKNFNGFYVKFALFRENLGYVAPNGEEIRYMFLIVGSESDTGYYLRTLAHIARIIGNDNVRNELLQAKNTNEIRGIFSKYENKALEESYAWK